MKFRYDKDKLDIFNITTNNFSFSLYLTPNKWWNGDFQQTLYMREIYKSLTEHDGQAGVLKPLLSEPDLEALRQNPFHISGSNIQVKQIDDIYTIIIYISSQDILLAYIVLLNGSSIFFQC